MWRRRRRRRRAPSCRRPRRPPPSRSPPAWSVADPSHELSPPHAARKARLAAPSPATPRKPAPASASPAAARHPRPSARILSSSSAMHALSSGIGSRRRDVSGRIGHHQPAARAEFGGDRRTESLRHPVELDRSAVLRHLPGPSSLHRSPDGRRAGSCHRPWRRSRDRRRVFTTSQRNPLPACDAGGQDRRMLTTYRSNFIGGTWVDIDRGAHRRRDRPGDRRADGRGGGVGSPPTSTGPSTPPPPPSTSGRRPRPAARAGALLRFADAIEADADELVRIESQNVGKPIAVTPPEVEFLVDNLRFFAGARAGVGDAGAGRVPHRLHVGAAARAARRGRAHRAVELPDDDGRLEGRARRWPPAARSCSSRRS